MDGFDYSKQSNTKLQVRLLSLTKKVPTETERDRKIQAGQPLGNLE